MSVSCGRNGFPIFIGFLYAVNTDKEPEAQMMHGLRRALDVQGVVPHPNRHGPSVIGADVTLCQKGAARTLAFCMMTTIEQLRSQILRAVERSSFRAVAQEVGMSPTGLKKFTAGASPYTATLRRLRTWYLNQTTADPQQVIDDRVSALTDLVQPEDRDLARAEILHILGSVRLMPHLASQEVGPPAGSDSEPPPTAVPAVPAGHTRCTSCGQVVAWRRYVAHQAEHTS
jgi:hypothetical protein